MASVIVISFSDLSRDPRVQRQIRVLAENHVVTAVGYTDPGVAGITFIPISWERKSTVGKITAAIQLLSQRYMSYYWQQARVRAAFDALNGTSADLVIANDIESLPLALRIAGEAKVVLDAHEYAPRQFEDRLRFRLFMQSYVSQLCRTYIPQVEGVMTVGEEIARQYEADTGIRPVVVTNAPDFAELHPQPVAPEGRIRLVHHGGATPSRKLENMIRVMDYLGDGYELDFLLVGGPQRYRTKLERLAAKNPRIRFLEPVPMRELPRFLNQYDIGIYLLEPVSFNARFALPNKIFEFIQARLAVAVGPSPEMARLVDEHDVGVVAPDFSPAALAKCIRACSPERISEFKKRSNLAAAHLCAETNRERVLAVVHQALAEPPRAHRHSH